MGSVEEIAAFITAATKGLVNKPEKVFVDIANKPGGKLVCLVINCDLSDLGCVIGKHERNIKSLRELAFSMGAKNKLKIQILLNE